MSKPGSHDHAASIAARRALEAGLTRLGIALVTHVAARGTNFQTDVVLQDEIRRPDGRAYHRESIGRKRRELTRAGYLSAQRIFPGQRPPGATYRTSHGVVATKVLWEAFRVSAPTLRGARRAERIQLARQSRPPSGELMTPAELSEAAEAFLRKQSAPPRPKPPPDA
jgi:hypothetical protein